MATMDFLFIGFLACSVLWYLRYMNNKYQAKKFCARMYELRDNLRDLAFIGAIKEDEMYRYFDLSFEKMIKSHQYFNLYTIFLIVFLHRKDEKAKKNAEALSEYCRSHPELSSIHEQYWNAVYKYIKGQHKLLHAVLFTFAVISNARQKLIARITAIVRRLMVYPETSVSNDIDIRAAIYKIEHRRESVLVR